MSEIPSDVVIVGGGIAGLWLTKECIDAGMSVQLVEQSTQLANGATVKNEGWLHAGTYHAVAIESEQDAMAVAERTKFGHDAYESFVPEAIESSRSFALIADPDLVAKAEHRWQEAGVLNKRIAPSDIPEPAIDISRAAAIYEVRDKSIHTPRACQKLAEYVVRRGATIYTGAEVHLVANGVDIRRPGEHIRLLSEAVVISAGAGIKKLAEQITGEPFPMRYFKAHLAITPKLTEHNYFYIDIGEAGVMQHGAGSIIGINRDGIELFEPDLSIERSKLELVHRALCRLVPSAARYPVQGINFQGVACVKPDIYAMEDDIQDLNVRISEAIPGTYLALPGKMTEAPFMAKSLIAYLREQRGFTTKTPQTHHSPSPTPYTLQNAKVPTVTPRPLDEWLQSQPDGIADVAS